MPFDAASPAPSVQVSIGPLPTRAGGLCPLSMGVFQYDGAWKVYCEFEPATAYPTRDMALSVAETLALEAARGGRQVELFIQDETGDLKQAAIDVR